MASLDVLLILLLLQQWWIANPSAALATMSPAASDSSLNNLELWTNDFTFAQAQSRAQCLHTYVDDLMTQSAHDKQAASELSNLLAQPHRVMESCTSSVSCRGCLAATLFHPRLAVCQQDCKDSVFCEQSCKRLRSIASTRPGSCPTVTDPRSTACNSACSTDMDCVYADGYKCCNIGVCRACRRPAPDRLQLGQLPVSPQPRLLKARSGLLLTWPTLENATVEQQLKEPIVYAVQARYLVGRRFESERASAWQNVSLVTGGGVGDSGGVAVEEVRAGHIYQFRVAAVTRLGSRGFGPASEPYSSGSAPQPPGAPSRLSEGRLRIYSSGRVSVQVHWEPPGASELPVHFYQIRWAKDHGFVNSDGSVLSMTRFSNSRPANARNYLIENLEPGTSYKVEVRAASLWGDETLLGPPNSIYVSTPQPDSSAPHPASNSDSWPASSSASSSGSREADEACSAAASASAYESVEAAPHQPQPASQPFSSSPGASATPLHIQPPVYEAGQLSVKMLILGVSVGSEESLYRVQWRRRVCIDTPGDGKLFHMTVVAQRGYFKLTELQFNCRYSVRLSPIDGAARQRLRNITACFRTPSCDEVKVAVGSQPPEQCPTALEAQLPDAPGRIRVTQLGPSGPSLDYMVSWAPSSTTAAAAVASSARQRLRQPAISGYCVVWGPRLDEPVSQNSYWPPSGQSDASQLASANRPSVQSDDTGLYPQMDPDRAITRVLGRANTSLVIRDLQPGKLYIVQVHSQAFINGQLLVSRSSSYFFATPPGIGGSGGGGTAGSQKHQGGNSAEIYFRINADQQPLSSTGATTKSSSISLLIAVSLLTRLLLNWACQGA